MTRRSEVRIPRKEGRVKKWRAALLLATGLCAVMAARAQDGVIAAPNLAVAPDQRQIASAGRAPVRWQLAAGYQYDRTNVRGLLNPFSTNGIQVSATRFFSTALGIESQFGLGFGSASPKSSTRVLFAGGGPRLAYRGHGLEPWGHVLIGVEQLTFENSNLLPHNTSLGWIAGGGLDYHFKPRFSIRSEYDYVGTHFSGAFQRNYKIGTGLVFNF